VALKFAWRTTATSASGPNVRETTGVGSCLGASTAGASLTAAAGPVKVNEYQVNEYQVNE